MKTTINRIVEKVFQGAAILGLSATFLFAGTVYAQQKEVTQSDKSTASVPGRLQASIFPSLDPLMLKIVFVNPARESVILIVRNADKETVYKKVISDTESYNSKLDVAGLPDGRYTFEIKATEQSFSQSFEITTQTARLTHVQ